MRKQRPGGRRAAAAVIAVVLGVGGLGTVAYAISARQSAPQPPSSSVSSPTSPQPSGSPASEAPGTALPESEPTSIRIPAIDVSSPVDSVGLNPDGTMEVPQIGPHYDHAAWYEYSPTPGEVGPSVIIGHIDSAEKGPSVFFRLAELRPGERVMVTRRDGTVAVFAVDKVENYPKDQFPTRTVYGNTERPELRLITCGGSFNEGIGHYTDNIVVFGHLIGSRSASSE